MKNKNTSDIILYMTPNSKIKIDVHIVNENLWLTQSRIAKLFGVDRTVITKHLKNIFISKELMKSRVFCEKGVSAYS